ncbi:MAG: hypothetical protein AB1411_14870 [Nitrospirota bacterium]
MTICGRSPRGPKLPRAPTVARPPGTKRLPPSLGSCLFCLACLVGAAAAGPLPITPDIEVFVRAGCPRCAEAEVFLEALQRERPTLRILLRDVAQEPGALARLNELAASHGIATIGVPAFSLRGELLIGYAGPETTGARLRTLLDRPPARSVEPAPEGACVPEAAKPRLYAQVRRILRADNLTGALVAVVVLAVLVNLVELLCTAGFPAVYTQILTLHKLPWWEYYAYLGLYNVAYILDDGVMVAIAVVTLSRCKLQERAGRWLKLVSWAVMVGLGLVLIFEPGWLAW